jgi:hypothetical protein
MISCITKFTSPSVKKIDQLEGGDLHEAFHQEAKQQFDLENGNISVATMTGAYIMYLFYAVTGRDKAGRVFRLTAYDIYKQLGMEKHMRIINETWPDHWETTAASRVAWALFCQDW